MTTTFLLEQALNGLGYGLMLFMLAAGLTLVLGTMDILNLAHGSLYMLGGYVAATVEARSGGFSTAIVASMVSVAIIGLVLEQTLFRFLYTRGHLAQMVATFGLSLVIDDGVKMIWGASPLLSQTPRALAGSIQLLPGLPYPTYRLVILAAGLLFAGGLYVLINHTKTGMRVRAGASNRAMTALMGVHVERVFLAIFLVGAVLAAAAGALMGPLSTVGSGMGEEVLVPALVVIVIGGVGSVRGAFVASLLVGIVDTAGRAFLIPLLRSLMPATSAAALGPALASMSVYVLMALVLSFKQTGLFPVRG